MEAQLVADKLRLATQIQTSHKAFTLVVSSAGVEWREELIQPMALVAEIMKNSPVSLDIASRPTRGKSSGTSGLVSGLHC